LGPHPRLPVVDDERLEQASVEHLDHVLVLERIGDEGQVHLGFALSLEPLVESLEALVVARRLANVHRLAREVLDGRNGRGGGTGDEDLAHRSPPLVEGHEIDQLLAFLGDGEVADGDVGKAVGELGQQAAARGRDEVDRERPLPELLRVRDVEISLEIPDEFCGQAPLTTLVAEETAGGCKGR
jgi:hypothetical protein